jgi:hypothetical protein
MHCSAYLEAEFAAFVEGFENPPVAHELEPRGSNPPKARPAPWAAYA